MKKHKKNMDQIREDEDFELLEATWDYENDTGIWGFYHFRV